MWGCRAWGRAARARRSTKVGGTPRFAFPASNPPCLAPRLKLPPRLPRPLPPAAYYYITYTTIELFASSLTAKTKLKVGAARPAGRLQSGGLHGTAHAHPQFLAPPPAAPSACPGPSLGVPLWRPPTPHPPPTHPHTRTPTRRACWRSCPAPASTTTCRCGRERNAWCRCGLGAACVLSVCYPHKEQALCVLCLHAGDPAATMHWRGHWRVQRGGAPPRPLPLPLLTAQRALPRLPPCPQKLLAHAPLAVDKPRFTDPHTKVNALLQVRGEGGGVGCLRAARWQHTPGGSGSSRTDSCQGGGAWCCEPTAAGGAAPCDTSRAWSLDPGLPPFPSPHPRTAAVSPVPLPAQPRHGGGRSVGGGQRHAPAAGHGGRHLLLGLAQPRAGRCGPAAGNRWECGLE